MLLPFAERSIEGRESNEERADLPHRVLDSLPRTLHLSPISHGPRDAFGCGGRSVRAARGEPPNGSRLSCGRLARRRKSSGRQSVPARAQHSASLKAITARQLQALVRRHAPRPGIR